MAMPCDVVACDLTSDGFTDLTFTQLNPKRSITMMLGRKASTIIRVLELFLLFSSLPAALQEQWNIWRPGTSDWER